MALRFFRKHKKYGLILLLGAMFAMVTFGTLAKMPRLLEQLKMRAKAGKAQFVLKNYGKEVSRTEAEEIRHNLSGMARLQQVIERAMKDPKDPLNKVLTWPKLSAIMTYGSPMPRRFATAGGLSAENLTPEATKVWQATAVLLKEAEMAGVVVTEEMARAHLDQWRQAGVEEDLIRGLSRISFLPPEMMRRPLSSRQFERLNQRLVQAIRQEMVLNIYLSNLMSGGKAFEEDVNTLFRLRSEKAEILKAELAVRPYRLKAAEPTEEEIQAHFEQYKDKLAGQTDNLFGCKLPNRVKFEYLKVKIDSFKPGAQVTDQEIEKYYEENKDPKYVIEEKEQPKTGQPSDDEDEKANDGGGAGPATDAAPPEEATATQEPATAEAAGPEKTVEKPKPEKKFKPLAEVRDTIKTDLLEQKARQACRDKAEEIYRQLLRRPQLSLENLADGEFVAYQAAEKLFSREDLRAMPGIGGSFIASRDPRQWMPTFFGDLVFRIQPFSKTEEIYKGRPEGVLSDGAGNCYIFVVTEVAEAEVPKTVDPVRKKVVQDLKKKAAYALAEREAEELLALARQEGLEKAVKKKGLKVVVAPETVRRPYPEEKNPMVLKVFEAVDAGESFGVVGTAKLNRVTVFEIKKVVRVTDAEYKAGRPWMTGQAIRRARSSVLRELIDPEQLFKRSGFVDLTKKDKDKQNKSEGGGDQQQPEADGAKGK
ncbi:MAG: hypothetical protein GWP05_04770 [Anaerolineaceae bacterium]|nr:hypothetical protein [Anaerolineaceae bacterium]